MLLIHLPLNKEGLFLNQGLADVTVINNGATYDANGKIGGCYKFTPGSDNASLYMYLNKTSADIIEQSGSFSLACWFIRTGNLYSNGCGLITCNQYRNFGFGLYLKNNGGFGFMMCDETSETEWKPTFYSEINKWTHVCVTYDKITHQLSLYINGEYKASNSMTFDWKHRLNQNIYIGKGLQGGWGYTLNGSMNDVRIYDHCLSPHEIHEIAKGLVLHYPMNDEYVESTTNIIGSDTCGNLSNGTWGGHTYTSVKYTITSSDPVPFKECQKHTLTYSGSGGGGSSTYSVSVPVKGNTTYCYSRYIKTSDNFTYTHPNFLYCYEYANSTYVTEAGVFSNSRKKYIGNGWYRCWGVFTTRSETTSLNLFFFTYPNKNVEYLLGGILLEEKDHMTPYTPSIRNELVYDCSGYCNNGTVTGNLQTVDDSPRYKLSTKITTSNTIKTTVPVLNNIYSFSWWYNKADFAAGDMMWGYADGNRINPLYSLCFNVGDSTSSPWYIPGTTTKITAPSGNTWHHFVITGDGNTSKLYVDGNLYGICRNFKPITGSILHINGWSSGGDYRTNGKISDFRIYSTALSEDDIKELYNTSAIINNNNTLESYEFSESNTYSINKSGVLEGAEFIEQDGDVLINNTEQVFATEFTEI